MQQSNVTYSTDPNGDTSARLLTKKKVCTHRRQGKKNNNIYNIPVPS